MSQTKDDYVRVQPEQDPVSLTKQSHALETDVHKIVSKYVQTGVWPMQGKQPMYGDFSNGTSFHELLARVDEAEEQFMMLPSAVRDFCDNDPGVFLDNLNDPERLQAMIDRGLEAKMRPAAVQEPVEPGSNGNGSPPEA